MECDSDGFPKCVPPELKRAYANKGIKKLFDWQTECLSDKDIYAPAFSNLIYTAPTGGGKTMIAEILAACNVLKTKRRAILAFPFISTAKEKLVFLQVSHCLGIV
jgi:replicative superfamily II helicase